jgi:hypothetical protein
MRLASLIISAIIGATLAAPGIGNLVGDVGDTTCVEGDTTCVVDDGTETGDEPAVEDEDEGTPETTEVTEAEEGTHGALVSQVAKCAPRGAEAKEAGNGSHGSFVKAAAHGSSATVGEDEFDTSTTEGAQALCDAFAAPADEPAAEETADSDAPAHGKGHAHKK